MGQKEVMIWRGGRGEGRGQRKAGKKSREKRRRRQWVRAIRTKGKILRKESSRPGL